MSLVDLIRALLILVTERLERDMTQMGSRVSRVTISEFSEFSEFSDFSVILNDFLSAWAGLN